jgi:formylglycine-generating enzyme required for sulfatase activity
MNSRTILRVAAAWSALAVVASAPGQSCDGDIDGDGQVSGADLSVVLAGWGPCAAGSSCAGDITGDGTVNGTDLTALLAGWGPCVTVPSWATLIEALPDPAVVHDAALRASIVATGLAWRVFDTATQLELVLVPPVTFQQGCSSSLLYSCTTWEVPVHQVTLTQPFYIGRYEVTQAQWQVRMGSNPSAFQAASAQVPADQVPNRPVEQVSWIMVQMFLSGTGLRLPTESEWEIAYRAGTTTAYQSLPGYAGGTNDEVLLDEISWYLRNSDGQTHPIGLKAGNGFGLHDMSGNVWEWVSDRWGDYTPEPKTDPTGPAEGSFRVIRGGSWVSGPFGVRSSYRFLGAPDGTSDGLGFRVARSP